MPTESPRELLELMLGHLGFSFEVEVREENGQTTLNILTRDPGRLIGRDGRTLDDLQYLLNRMIGDGDDSGTRVSVDVEGYRKKEIGDFLSHVREAAERVRKTGKVERLGPMNSFDRRLVHQAYVDDPDITTESEVSEARLKCVCLRRTGS